MIMFQCDVQGTSENLTPDVSFLMRHSVLGCVLKLKIYTDRILQQEIGTEMLNEMIIFSM